MRIVGDVGTGTIVRHVGLCRTAHWHIVLVLNPFVCSVKLQLSIQRETVKEGTED
jgi:hypothetical protein